MNEKMPNPLGEAKGGGGLEGFKKRLEEKKANRKSAGVDESVKSPVGSLSSQPEKTPRGEVIFRGRRVEELAKELRRPEEQEAHKAAPPAGIKPAESALAPVTKPEDSSYKNWLRKQVEGLNEPGAAPTPVTAEKEHKPSRRKAAPAGSLIAEERREPIPPAEARTFLETLDEKERGKLAALLGDLKPSERRSFMNAVRTLDARALREQMEEEIKRASTLAGSAEKRESLRKIRAIEIAAESILGIPAGDIQEFKRGISEKLEPRPAAPERKIPKKATAAGVADSALADKFEQARRIEDATRGTVLFHGKRVELPDADKMAKKLEAVPPTAGSKPEEEVAPEPSPAVESPETGPDEEKLKAALEAARKDLVEADKKRDASAEEFMDYPQVLEKYEKARAEYVGNDVAKYVLEQTALLKQRTEREPGRFEWAREKWRKLGAVNITNVWGVSTLGKKIEQSGKLGFFASRVVNARTVTSGALFGLATILPAAALPLTAVRSAMAGAGAAFGTYEVMEKRRLAKIASISEKELEEMPTEDVKEKLLQLSAFAHVSGSWENVRDAFDKLKDKYEKDLTEAITKGTALENYMLGEAERSMAMLGAKLGEEEESRKKRLLTAWGAGALAVVGVPLIRKWLGFANAPAPESPKSGITVLPDMPKNLPTEAETAYARELLARAAKEGADAPQVAPGAVEVGEAARELARGSTAVSPEELQAGDFEEVARLYKEGIKEFKLIFQPGEGPIHEARKALALYIAGVGEKVPALQDLTPAQKIWAEERLWKLTQAELKGTGALKDIYHPGDSIAFSRENIEKVLAELKEKFGTPEKVAKLNENLKDFTGRVNWNRYVVQGARGVWEMDNGIRVKIPAKAAAEALQSSGGDILEDMRRGLEEKSNFVVPGEEYEEPVQVMDYHPDFEKLAEAPAATAETVEFPEADEAGGEAVSFSPEDMAKFKDAVVSHLSGLKREYYDLVKGMSVEDFLKKKMFSLTAKDQFPFPVTDAEYPWIRQDRIAHNRMMDFVRFQQKIRRELSSMAPEEASGFRAMSVDNYIRKFILRGK